jgi:hypothetical protein
MVAGEMSSGECRMKGAVMEPTEPRIGNLPTATPRNPVWPTVIGVLSMVQSAQPMLFAVWAIRDFLEGLDISPSLGWDYPLACHLGALAAPLLLLGGYLLVKRRRIALVFLLGYAFVYATSLIGSWILSEMQLQEMESRGWCIYWIGVRHSGFVTFGYCLFLIVWFLRRSIRREMRAWPPRG